MKKGYLVIRDRALSKITEFSYTSEAKQTYGGCKKVRDVVGTNYYFPSRIYKESVYHSLKDAKLALSEYILDRLREYEDLYAQTLRADLNTAREVV